MTAPTQQHETPTRRDEPSPEAAPIHGGEPSPDASSMRPIRGADFDVLIVGAGFAGMMALTQLRRHGFTVIAVERGPEVGGTWYWNRYPGLRCDIESMDYSYSWDEQLQQEWAWSERYAAQPEILEYARHVAEVFDLRRDIRFNTEVTALHFDADSTTWAAQFSDGSSVRAHWVILATGALSTPKPVDIPGVANFRGEIFHTTNWPKQPVSFAGRRVAIVGTGSSGIQAATQIAKEAEHLYVLQRTPSYSVPAFNRPLTPEEVAEHKAHYDEHRARARVTSDGMYTPGTGKRAEDMPAEERQRELESRYQSGLPFSFFGVFNNTLLSEYANQQVQQFLADKIRSRVNDPEIAEKLVPSGAPFGTRRTCLDVGYYEIFNQANVTLVALRETPIKGIVTNGVETSAGITQVDTIVFATGYDAFTGTAAGIDIVGTNGQTLKDSWGPGAHSYLGLMVAGFPNLFLVTGPQSPSVLSNMIVSIEQHTEWIVTALLDARSGHITRMEADADAEQAWLDHAATVADSTLYRDAASWYVGANVPGKPRVVLPYLGGVGNFRVLCAEVAADDYRGFLRQTESA